MTVKEFENFALSFEGMIEKSHFEKTVFKVIDKRIFATILEEMASLNIVLPIKDRGCFAQSIRLFTSFQISGARRMDHF